MSDLDDATPPARILRVGRKPNPWAWPRWEIVGEAELDGAVIRQTAPRRFTQEISSYLYSLSDRQGHPRFAGIAYVSRFGDRYRNWAIFERPTGRPVIRNPSTRPIDPARREFRAALRLLGLRLGA